MPDYTADFENMRQKARQRADAALAAAYSSINQQYEANSQALKSQIGAYELQAEKDTGRTNEGYDQLIKDVSNYDLARGMIRSTNAGNRYENTNLKRAADIKDINANLTMNLNNINAALGDLERWKSEARSKAQYDIEAQLTDKEMEIRGQQMAQRMQFDLAALSAGGGGGSKGPQGETPNIGGGGVSAGDFTAGLPSYLNANTVVRRSNRPTVIPATAPATGGSRLTDAQRKFKEDQLEKKMSQNSGNANMSSTGNSGKTKKKTYWDYFKSQFNNY